MPHHQGELNTMRYTGKARTRTVTLHLGFIDQPIEVRNLNDLPPGYHFKLTNPDTITEVLEAVLPDDLAHIILYQGTSNDLEEFMNAWVERSEAQDRTKKTKPTPTPDQDLSTFLTNIIRGNPYGPQ